MFIFGDYRLDIERRELLRGSEPVALEPQVFDLLVYLVRNRHRVVSKDDLLRDVWGGRIVSDSALAARIHAARRAVDDDGNAQRLIRTFARKGVRFVGDVDEPTAQPRPSVRPVQCGASTIQRCPDLSGLPSIAVLPFANFTGDRDFDRFAGGLGDEITIALSRIGWLVVVAGRTRHSAANGYPDGNEPARELGVRYCLVGAVSESGGQLRTTVHLTDAETGAHLWADHFEGSPEDVFALEDKVAASVAGVIEPLLQALEGTRAVNCPACDLGTHGAYLRAFAMLASARRVPAALALLERALERDPEHGPALALAANCHMRCAMDQISSDPAEVTRKGAECAWRALELTPDDPNVLANVARPLAYAGEEIGATITLMDRALTLNPNFARGWYVRGFLKYWSGECEAAIADVEHARRLSPRGRIGTALTVIGNALMFKEQFEEALPVLYRAVHEDPTFPPNYRLLAVCHAHLGQIGAARAALAKLPKAAPLNLVKIEQSYRAMFRNPDHRELSLAGIRKAIGV